MQTTNEQAWWQRSVIYQIYPRSFQDSNGDGVGDLAGIGARLDYLEWLGIDAVWLSPIYPSPMKDFGYDVSDYTNVHPLFGTLADVDALITDAHRRGMKVILDFVPNHTSNEHPWFIESRSSRRSAKRDWYLWRDPKPDGSPPNNWLSVFGGSAWEFDANSGQYYYHAYLREQPDLNWRNPEVQDAMLSVLRFWLDRGVDGFRVDVIWHIVKDDQLRDNPANPEYREGMWPYRAQLATYTTDRPEVHDIVARMRAVLDSYPGDRMMVGEVYLPIERLVTYYGAGGKGAHLPFNFQLIELPWDARTIAEAIERYEAALPAHGWPNWVLGNHDKPRVASRLGRAQARVAAVLLLTLRGVPTLYYGDELGMEDVPIPPDRVRDPWEKRVPGYGLGRDPVRTPMPWDATHNGAFTSGAPWLPLGADSSTRNVVAQRADPQSELALYRRLIALRRSEPVLLAGTYAPIEIADGGFSFERRYADRRLFISLNMSGESRLVTLPGARGTLLLSSHLDREAEPLEAAIRLRANEAAVVEIRD